MSLVEIHGRLANTALMYASVMAFWGLWRYFRKQNVSENYWGALVIGEALFLVQALLGAYLHFSGTGDLVGRGMHILYGLTAVLVLPVLFAFTHGHEQRRINMVYGAGFLFLVGILIRSIATAG